MRTIWLHVQAPFAAFRWLQAGVYRATSPVIPHSAAWGLVLNLAGIDVRDATANLITTGTRKDAPRLEIAVGSMRSAQVTTLYQQLHTYPVGSSGKDLAPRTHGSKYWIAPVRREVLVGLECVLGVRGEPRVVDRIRPGLEGSLGEARYGLPFAGDNNFLFDRIDVDANPRPACWYTPVDEAAAPSGDTCRLLVGIDRLDSSRTVSRLFAPRELAPMPPKEAWIWVPEAPR